MDYATLIEKKRLRIPELESLMAQDGFFDDPRAAREMTREYNRTKALLEDWDSLEKAKEDLVENQELAKGDDADFAEMAAEEIPELEKKIEDLEGRVQYALLPHDPTEDRDAIVEIRAGTGGDEASLFAGDLYRMYQRYAETRRNTRSSPSGAGVSEGTSDRFLSQGPRSSRVTCHRTRLGREVTGQAAARGGSPLPCSADVSTLPDQDPLLRFREAHRHPRGGA